MTKEFTDEEFEATDPFYAIHGDLEQDNTWLSMKNIQFAVDHSHENESVLLTQRFVHSKVTPEGFTESQPYQVSLIIPIDQLEIIMLEAIANAGCILFAKKEGKSSHEAE